MRKTKVYDILKHFDKYEQNRCRKYIISPYFNSDEVLINLYELILVDLKSNKPSEDSKFEIWKQLGVEKVFDDIRLRKYFSDLLKLVEGYLLQQKIEGKVLERKMNLLEAANDIKVKSFSDSSVKKVKKIINKYVDKSAKYQLSLYKFEDLFFELEDIDNQRVAKGNYDDIMYHLDQFFLAEKFRIYSEILSRKALSTYEYNVSLMSEITKYVEENLYNVEPIVTIYYRIYKTYVDFENEENYKALKNLVRINTKFLPQKESNHIFTFLINYCVGQINKGESIYFRELFNLYRQMIDYEVLTINNELSPWHFKNIVLSALKVSEFNWGINFIEDYAAYLPDEFRNNAITFNLARLYFSQKKYQKVLELIREVEYEDMSYNIESKTMLLMTYYDTDEIEPLYSLMDSFRVYLNRHKEIPEQRKNYYKNLIKFTKRLTKIIPGDKKAIDKVKKEIEDTPGFKVKWLGEKIAELERR